MKSATLPSFWSEYYELPLEIRQAARKAYHLWSSNPFHPSLHFKCINRDEDILFGQLELLEITVLLEFWNKIRLHGFGLEVMINMRHFLGKLGVRELRSLFFNYG